MNVIGQTRRSFIQRIVAAASVAAMPAVKAVYDHTADWYYTVRYEAEGVTARVRWVRVAEWTQREVEWLQEGGRT